MINTSDPEDFFALNVPWSIHLSTLSIFTHCVHTMLDVISVILFETQFVSVLAKNEADSALRKARLLQAQRQEEYEKAKVSTNRLEEEHIGGGGGAAAFKQLEKRRRLEEEALQKVLHLHWRFHFDAVGTTK